MEELGRLKEAGQTYDELLEEIMRAYNRRQLAEKARSARKGEGERHQL